MSKAQLNKIAEVMYKIVNDINKKYKLTDEDLYYLNTQGFRPFIENFTSHAHREGEEIGLDSLTNVISSSVASLFFGP